MPAARIIPCLDVADGRVVKGVRFRNHRDMGSILDLAQRYCSEGADELVFYDITANTEGRTVDRTWISAVSEILDIPFCVAGGIRSVESAEECLAAGADKISINSPALERPHLITELSQYFGSQCVVVGIDSKTSEHGWVVKQYTGKESSMRDTNRLTLEWAKEAAERGAGEIVLNCMDVDGVRQGFDVAQLTALIAGSTIPVIASGGAGAPQHFLDAIRAGASGVLAASVFHDQSIGIADLKAFLAGQGVEIRR